VTVSKSVIIVSGLPRSGTSMMMNMLQAGGLAILTDNVRTADEDNPKGYYEFEQVKQIEQDPSWVEDAQGKVVKLISALLKHLPADHHYKVIFMRRKIEEVLASQRQMLIRRNEPTDTVADQKMADLYRRHLKQVEAWLAKQPNIDVLYVTYHEVVANPREHAEQINAFLGGGLDVEAMAGSVDKELYRQRV
jgi:Sulfotransferase domain